MRAYNVRKELNILMGQVWFVKKWKSEKQILLVWGKRKERCQTDRKTNQQGWERIAKDGE